MRTPSRPDPTSRTVLITGASAGIGRALARVYAAEGWDLILTARRIEPLEALAQELRRIGRTVHVTTEDLADPAAPERLWKAMQAQGLAIDGLVNNAGIYPRGVLGETTAAFFDHMFAINTRAPLLCAEAAIRAFRLQKSGGSILTVGSINAWCGNSNLTVYSMSKGALMTMTRNLANTLGPERIRANQLNVGWTWTANEDATQQREGRKPGWQNHLPLRDAPTGRIMQPEEIAAHTAFWLSEESGHVSGQIYEVEQFPLIGRGRAAD